MYVKKHINNLEKKIMCISLALLIGITLINPIGVTFAFTDFEEIQTVFTEELSEDKLSSHVKLVISENENQVIESIQLPDGTKVIKDEFQRNNENKLLFEYNATENKTLEYVVKYTENEENQTEMKTKTVTYEVSDIKTVDDMKLEIDAKDISYSIGEEVDFRKDIIVHNEDNIDITNQLDIDILNYGGYKDKNIGEYEFTYQVKHPVSQKEYTFSRNIVINGEVDNKKEEPTEKKSVQSDKVKEIGRAHV